VLGNLLAMPLVSAWIMPTGILGLVAIPFGLDGPCWKLMGVGIEWMIAIAVWVTSLPGAVGRVPAFGIGPLLICAGGLVLLCLLRTPLRLVGLALIGLSVASALHTRQPDVLVAADGSAVAVRGAAGRLAMIKSGSDTFAFREWLAADADRRAPTDKSLDQGIRCDGAGCVGKLADGSLVAIARSIEAFADDCRRAAVVVSTRAAPADCPALVIDRQALRRTGAVAVRRVGQGFEVTPARPLGYDRPWARAASTPDQSAETSRPAAGHPPPRDATPNVQDLEVGD
jgi:competence protein ComEC